MITQKRVFPSKPKWPAAIVVALMTSAFAGTLSSCSTAQKSASSPQSPTAGSTSGTSGGYGPPESYGPQPDSPNSNGVVGPTESGPAYGPEPVQIRSVVLVLGPGRARGFAHAGVIRALADAKVPIGAIYATEMGSLIGAIYAMEGKVNQLDWALMKFKSDLFKLESGIFSGILGNQDRLTGELEKVFGKKDLSEAKIPVHISLQLEKSRTVTVATKGSVVQAVRAALGTPAHPGSWDGVAATSAAKAQPFTFPESDAPSLGPVVVVDTTASGAASSATRTADVVIRPLMRGLQESDYEKRSEAVFAGKKALLEKLNEIRQRVGLTQTTANEFEKASAKQ